MVSIGSNLIAFEINNQSTISGLPASIVITGPAVVVLEESLLDRILGGLNRVPSIPTNDTKNENKSESSEGIKESDFTANIDQTSFMATIGNILTFGTENKAIGFLVVITMIVIIYCGINFLKKNKRK
jgi:hypothetical protein